MAAKLYLMAGVRHQAWQNRMVHNTMAVAAGFAKTTTAKATTTA
ncbi:MAG: hypothetical protein R3D02_13270 [Hyphomicrobiales bacterium]